MNESSTERTQRILGMLKAKYPDAECWDIDGKSWHFVAEIEPSRKHPEYDRAVEVILTSSPHKHHKMTQHYTILTGHLKLHDGDGVFMLGPGDQHTVEAGKVHWADSRDEAMVEIYSTPGWTREDHIEMEPPSVH